MCSKRCGDRSSQLVLAALVIGMIGACASIRSGAHFDDSAPFAAYRTFAWIADEPLIAPTGQATFVSPLTQKKITQSLAKAFAARGYALVADPVQADFVVSYTVGTRDRIDASAYPVAYRGAWGRSPYGWYHYETTVVHRMYTEGTLGVDVFDGKTKEPIWHGWATKTISTSDLEDPAPSIDAATTAIVAHFPPSQ